MSREIKFRAWTKSKEMKYNVVPFQWDYCLNTMWHKCISSNGIGVLGSGGTEATFEIGGFSIIEGALMQYTGLKDKTGKEIYEGDIVEAWSEGYKHVGEIRWRLEGQPAIIIYPAFANQGFWKIHGQQNAKGEWIDDGVEVIGNIYQNANLLQP